jgi:hypothetical protein
MKRQAYTILLLTSFSAFALDEAPSGLIAVPRQANKSNNWNFTAGFACTAAIGGAAAFAVYKMQRPDSQLWQKCTIPALSSALAAVCCERYATNHINSIKSKLVFDQNYSAQANKLTNEIAKLEAQKASLTPEALEKRDKELEKEIAQHISDAKLYTPLLNFHDKNTWTKEKEAECRTKINTADTLRRRKIIQRERLAKTQQEEHENLDKQIAAKEALLNNLPPQDQVHRAAERNTKIQSFHRFALGGILGTAAVACASAYYYFLKR